MDCVDTSSKTRASRTMTKDGQRRSHRRRLGCVVLCSTIGLASMFGPQAEAWVSLSRPKIQRTHSSRISGISTRPTLRLKAYSDSSSTTTSASAASKGRATTSPNVSPSAELVESPSTSSYASAGQVQKQDNVFQKGVLTISILTLIFASNSPLIHGAFSALSNTPPVLLLNALVGLVGLTVILFARPLLEQTVPDKAMLGVTMPYPESDKDKNWFTQNIPLEKRAGMELGLLKFAGVTFNLYGLSLTSSNHGAFLVQLTTLLVPLAQGMMGVPITQRLWTAIAMAMTGVYTFSQDPAAAGGTSLLGDAFCVVTAFFFASYDIRIYHWSKHVPTYELITTKLQTHAALSILALLCIDWSGAMDFVQSASLRDATVVAVVALWSGLTVNGMVPYLQVGGQQAIGPTRAQIIYASQPLWAAIMSYFLLGETVGTKGLIGGSLFVAATMLASGSESSEEGVVEPTGSDEAGATEQGQQLATTKISKLPQ